MTERRLVVVDTETTGLFVENGERVIEIACVEIHGLATLQTRFHTYLDPEKEVEQEAVRIHGQTWLDLKGQPKFAEIAGQFLEVIQDADVVMHQAEFDRKFIDQELEHAGLDVRIGHVCNVIDSLALARAKYPKSSNDLNALCRRFKIDLSSREVHGALIDAELLARVYIRMISGEQELFKDAEELNMNNNPVKLDASTLAKRKPVVVRATVEETALHETYMEGIKVDRC